MYVELWVFLNITFISTSNIIIGVILFPYIYYYLYSGFTAIVFVKIPVLKVYSCNLNKPNTFILSTFKVSLLCLPRIVRIGLDQ